MKIVLSGYGRMGRMVEEVAAERGHEIIGRMDIGNLEEWAGLPAADVVIDFSNPAMQQYVHEYIRRTGAALISGTTGYQAEQMEEMKSLAEYAPVLYSANYSLGVAVFRYLLEQIPEEIKAGFDIEILEKHHNKKVDAPSGTAKMLLAAVDREHTKKVVSGRDGICGARTSDEIGVMALRGGTVAGEHTVYFFGQDETLEITHRAASRRIFAAGAVHAAEALAGRDKGWYQLDEILFGNKH